MSLVLQKVKNFNEKKDKKKSVLTEKFIQLNIFFELKTDIVFFNFTRRKIHCNYYRWRIFPTGAVGTISQLVKFFGCTLLYYYCNYGQSCGLIEATISPSKC